MGRGGKNYLLILLMLILAFNSVDRLALGLVLQDIKATLSLSDTQLGALTGIAFSLFYTLMGIPIARWADRGNRVTIIWLTTALWSVAVALCATVGNFWQLVSVRIGVAVGEAGCMPPANSLIPDYFTRAERPRAVARYMLASPLSVVIGYSLAGWLNQLYGWRVTFVVLGLPGLLLAALARLTLVEPRRAQPPLYLSVAAVPVRPSSLWAVCSALWANITFRRLLCCFAITSFFTTGVAQWQPTFLIRSYHLKTGELGTWLAVVWGLCAFVGTYAGGEWASRRAANREDRQLTWTALVTGAVGLIYALIYLSFDHYSALALMGLAALGGAATSGPLFATIQSLVPERMRAVSIALALLFANLLGMGLGPLTVGALSDTLEPWFGGESLRYALLAMCPGYFWGAWYLWRASRTVMTDLAVAHG